MPTMRFMSKSNDPKVLTKCFSFDSSAARAIGQAMGAGMYDESSYQARLVEDRGDSKVYEVKMRRKVTEHNPGPHPLQIMGMVTHTPSYVPVERPTLARR